MSFKLIIIVTLIYQSKTLISGTPQINHNLNKAVLEGNNENPSKLQIPKEACKNMGWMATYFCLATIFQKQHPDQEKVMEKFKKYVNQEAKMPINSYQYTNLLPQDIQRANTLHNIVFDGSNQKLAEQEYNRFQLKYNISIYDQLPFCIVVPSYQNVQNKRYERSLISILQQNYTNYHVVYIDDASPDKTSDYVNKFLEIHPLKNKVEVIRNQVNVGHLANALTAVRKYCKPNQFYFRVDGDDYLIGKQVLKLFNAVHQQHNQTWAIYSNAIQKHSYASVQLGNSRNFLESVIKNNDYRYSPFRFFVQQSFYTELFLKIKDQDLKDMNGNYFKNAGDAAYIWPILEMSGQRIYYLPQITYYYDYTTGMNQMLGQSLRTQVKAFMQIQHKPKYQIVDQLFKPEDQPQKLKVSK